MRDVRKLTAFGCHITADDPWFKYTKVHEAMALTGTDSMEDAIVVLMRGVN